MPTKSILALSALALAQTVSAVLWKGPKQTPCGGKAKMDMQGYSPRPTDAPGSGSAREHHHELFKRLVASARTCGFLTDSRSGTTATYAYTCDIGTCGYFAGSGVYAQACCYSGYSGCQAPTTCYDYTQYTSSRCTGSCSQNDFNLICSRTASPRCQTFTYPGANVKGYGCDTDTESTTTTVRSTFTSGASLGSFNAVSYTALFPSIPAFYLSSTTRTSFTYATTRYSGGGSSYSSYDDGITTAALVVVIIIAVVWGLGYVCALVVLILVCRRHKRNMTNIDQQNAARAAGNPIMASAVPFNGSNVMSPGSHQSGFFTGSDPHQSAFFANKSDTASTVQTYPAPVATPPPMAGSPATPQQGQTMYGTAMSPNTNSMYGFPQPGAPQQPNPQELYSPTPVAPLAHQQPQAYAYAPPAGAPPAPPDQAGTPVAGSAPAPIHQMP